RIDSHLRRSRRLTQQPHPKELTFKDLQVDTVAKTVTVNGFQLIVTAREYAILALLLSSPKKVFTKANVYESVWNEEFRGDDNTIN
ncbi:winged helix-turn-helix domain-containing protein, partial [Bacillus sp. MM2020_4]|uniref:winged helix-turn-helix domain-containing protein n=1 Tax=Bacillus sp. MM2020_4 TaxID=2714039 RepID=UPI0014074CAD